MLRYLRAQTTPGAKQFARLMLKHGTFSYNPTGQSPTLNQFFGVPDEMPQALQDRFDPSDDASDDDEDAP